MTIDFDTFETRQGIEGTHARERRLFFRCRATVVAEIRMGTLLPMFPIGFALSFLLPVVGPELPASTDLTFRRDVLALQEATWRLDFREAERLLAVLPNRTITISWDDTKVPADRKIEFAKARDKAIESWKELVPSLQISVVPKGRIRLSFEAELPPNADTTGPAGAVYFFSSDPDEARVEGILAQVRTAKKLQIDAKEVTNEVVYAIGVSLGLGEIAHIASPMNREEGLYRAVMPLSSVPSCRSLRVRRSLRTTRSTRLRA